MRLVLKSGEVIHLKAGSTISFSKPEGHSARVAYTTKEGDIKVVRCREVIGIDHKRGKKMG